MRRTTKLQLVVDCSYEMQEQVPKLLLCYLAGFASFVVSSLKSPSQLVSSVPVRPVGNIPLFLQNSTVLQQESEINPEGSYHWSYETEYGIKAEEKGTPSDDKDLPKVASGYFEYKTEDGTLISVKYVADEGGFRAEGAHLPTPPPIPIEIANALKWIAERHSTQ